MTKKINWILILLAWAMLWVVIGHSPLRMPIADSDPSYLDILYHVAYSFHMPLFIMVSGYLFYLTRIEKAKLAREKIEKERMERNNCLKTARKTKVRFDLEQQEKNTKFKTL